MHSIFRKKIQRNAIKILLWQMAHCHIQMLAKTSHEYFAIEILGSMRVTGSHLTCEAETNFVLLTSATYCMRQNIFISIQNCYCLL